MKKRLLKPPEKDGEFLFLPDISSLKQKIKKHTRIGVSHQPAFFNPGVSLKFLLIEELHECQKKIIFLDTDKSSAWARIPHSEGGVRIAQLAKSSEVLSTYKNLGQDGIKAFLDTVEQDLAGAQGLADASSAFKNFKELLLKNSDKPLLKDMLAQTFMEYYDIRMDYCFLSNMLKTMEYKELFLRIYKKPDLFREIYNKALDEYRTEFKFRFKHYPFPKLEKGEMPFWIIKNNERLRCFTKFVSPQDLDNGIVYPRAVTLTIFLRLYIFDLFIHGIGGANYEWIQDRIIERFFEKKPPPYCILSGTFLINNSPEREFPYFLYSPERIKSALKAYLA